MLEVCLVDPVTISFEFIFETVRAEGKFSISVDCGDESRITSVSEKKLLVTGKVGLIQDTVFSEVFESVLSVLKYFQLIADLGFIRLQW